MLDNNLELIYRLDNNVDTYYDNIKKILSTDFPCSKIINQKLVNNFTQKVILSFFIEENFNIFTPEYLKILKENVNKLEKGTKLISSNKIYNKFIYKLFRGKEFNFFYNEERFMYIKLDDSKEKHIFLQKFLEKFNVKMIESTEDLEFYLNLQRLNIPRLNYNFSIDSLLYDIYNKDYFPKTSNIFKINCDNDIENIERLKNSHLLKFDYFKGSLKIKFILLKNLLYINKKFNLPTNNYSYIIDNMSEDNYILTFNYFYYQQISKSKNIENFQCNKFIDENEAVSHVLDLHREKINGVIIIENNFLCVCYQNETNIEFTDNVEKNKSMIISRLIKSTSEVYDYTQKNLKNLVNIQIYKKYPIFEEDTNLFTEEGDPIPLSYILNKGYNFYNIDNKIGNFDNHSFPEFDRKNFIIDINFSITLAEKIEDIYFLVINIKKETVVLNGDLYIPGDIEDFEKKLYKMFKKGYFLTEFGIMRYLNSNLILVKDIKKPVWFFSNNLEEYNFIENFLNNI